MKKGDQVLDEMSATFRERAKIYGDNYLIMGTVLERMFPNGITLKTAEDHNRYHLFHMVMIKATRLAVTNLTHMDSGHDMGVYSAMLTGLLDEPVSSPTGYERSWPDDVHAAAKVTEHWCPQEELGVHQQVDRHDIDRDFVRIKTNILINAIMSDGTASHAEPFIEKIIRAFSALIAEGSAEAITTELGFNTPIITKIRLTPQGVQYADRLRANQNGYGPTGDAPPGYEISSNFTQERQERIPQ